ncbi:MAG: IS1595 family transposase [Xanthobacteraceae bacterium]|jgi:transposase-like protein
MANSILSAKVLQNEAAAIAWVEARVWPEGPVCPHCGGVERIGKMAGKATRIGLYKCYQCRKQFTVKVGTVFEDSHVPMNLWLQAMYLLCSSKKGISSNQLSRTLGVTLKTAWFMGHRIREAMRVVGVEPMGGADEIVEVDETIMGKVEGAPKRLHTGGSQNRNVVMTLVQRGGSARSFHVDGTAIRDIGGIIRENIDKQSALMTDEAKWYPAIARDFASHKTVNHGKDEYVRHEVAIEGDKLVIDTVTTNTVEGFYSIFKRGMKGVYQHCKEKHLHRYLSEFDFRYSNRVKLGVDDVARTERAVKGIVGKRLTYRPSHH